MNALTDLGKTVARYAPLLGAVLPVPGGIAMGQLVASMFNGDINKPEDLIKKIEADKDAAFKLAQFQLNHQLELERSFLADKQDARQREIEYIKATGGKDHTLKNLAFITTFGFFLALFVLFIPLIDINEQEKNLIMVLLGMLASKWQSIIDYYFGSSHNGNSHK